MLTRLPLPPLDIMPKTIDRKIQVCVDSFVSDVTALVRQAAVEAVADALGTTRTASARSRTTRTGKSPTKARKRVRRTAADLEKLGAQVLAQVKKKPGQRLGEIAKALRKETKDVRRPATDLLEGGLLRTEGQRGGTRYFPKGTRPRKTPTGGGRAKRKPTKKRAG